MNELGLTGKELAFAFPTTVNPAKAAVAVATLICSAPSSAIFGGLVIALTLVVAGDAVLRVRSVFVNGGSGAVREDEGVRTVSMEEKIFRVRSSHFSVVPGAGIEILPPRRFLVAFSSCDA